MELLSAARIAAAKNYSIELHALTNEMEMDNTERNCAAAAAFGIASDHHAGIVILLEHGMHSSSMALLRSLFESYLRGLWLRHCATDEEISDFLRKDVQPPSDMVARIEAIPGYTSGTLSRIKKNTWSAMCAFTHTGGLHLQRWHSADGIEPVFDLAELEECLNCAELFSTLAGVALLQLSKVENNGAEVLALMKRRWPDNTMT